MDNLKSVFGLGEISFEQLEHRSRVPLMLRDLVEKQGCVTVEISMTAATALAMANDIEFAVNEKPLGHNGEPKT